MRKAIKVTLNSDNVFDGVILEYLGNRKNMAGQLKRLAYDHISLSTSRVVQDKSIRNSNQTEGNPLETPEIREKLSKLGG
ncbi:MAG: hypothetical protein ACLP29_05015 [Dissulfurispiraceae bacterium]